MMLRRLIDESSVGVMAVEIFGISYSPTNRRTKMDPIPEPSQVLCRYLMTMVLHVCKKKKRLCK